jgi:soluble epoxide hydrolase / lipid-phosphate phosphatase
LQPDSTSSLVYPTDPEIWKVHFAPIGAAEAWITENKITDPAAWLTADEVATHKKILGQKGYTGPLNWYENFL